MDGNLQNLMEEEYSKLKKLKETVLQYIEGETISAKKMIESDEENASLQSRFGRNVTKFWGSWSCIFILLGTIFLWIGVNVYLLQSPLDPYPFIFLNLFLTAFAAIQGPVIMMTQNRKEERDRKLAAKHNISSTKSEIAFNKLHAKLDVLISEQMQTMFEIQKRQIELMEDIRTELMSMKNVVVFHG